MTPHAPLRVGIIGCGNVAGNHAAAYAELADVRLVGVSDVDLSRAEAFASRHRIGRAVGSAQDLLALGLDAVSVCTPHPTHESVVSQVAQAGVHILCEKPIAINVGSAQRMIRTAEDAGVILAVVFQRRYWPAAQALRAAIDEGRLGVPMLGHCRVLLRRGRDYYNSAPWRGTWDADGGGVLMTQAVHYIDLLQWFMGRPVEVSGKAGAFVLSDAIEVEDTAAALITFESGAVATLSATVTAEPSLGSQITITGSRGGTIGITEHPEGTDACLDLSTVPAVEQVASPFASGVLADLSVDAINAALAPLHQRQIRDFVEAVLTGGPPAVSGHEALNSLHIVEAVYASTRTGRPIRIDQAPTQPTFDHLPRFLPR